MESDGVYYHPSSYSSGAYDKHQRSLSPYAGAEMGRGPSNRGYSSSRWSTAAVSPSASSPGGYSPESPGGGITDSLSSFTFNSNNNEQQHQQQQQTYSAQYTEPTTSTSYRLHHSAQSPSSSSTSSSYSSTSQATATASQSQQQGLSWYQCYDFIAKVEPGQAPYWQLKPGFTPSRDYPLTMPVAQEADLTPRTSEILNTCLAPGCDSKPFKRKADLERHYQQVHWDPTTKTSYPCDYPRCPRATEYFYRRDHCRDHYREYHKEDLVRRTPGGTSTSSSSSKKKETADWWNDRNVSKRWWRCSKCLRRVSVQSDGFECRDCKAVCETERRRFRGYA